MDETCFILTFIDMHLRFVVSFDVDRMLALRILILLVVVLPGISFAQRDSIEVIPWVMYSEKGDLQEGRKKYIEVRKYLNDSTFIRKEFPGITPETAKSMHVDSLSALMMTTPAWRLDTQLVIRENLYVETEGIRMLYRSKGWYYVFDGNPYPLFTKDLYSKRIESHFFRRTESSKYGYPFRILVLRPDPMTGKEQDELEMMVFDFTPNGRELIGRVTFDEELGMIRTESVTADGVRKINEMLR